jgi:hypothetical protein
MRFIEKVEPAGNRSLNSGFDGSKPEVCPRKAIGGPSQRRIVDSVVKDHNVGMGSCFELRLEQNQLLIDYITFHTEIGNHNAILSTSI